jgi:UDP-N-acetylmuramyl tripeptide synthase
MLAAQPRPADPPPELVRGISSSSGAVEIVTDRRAALARGLQVTGPGDVLAVLGRTPAPMPYVGADESVVPFDDEAELRSLAGG